MNGDLSRVDLTVMSYQGVQGIRIPSSRDGRQKEGQKDLHLACYFY
jgi:hypothetical protein